MPIPPRPLAIRCPKCGWQHSWQPASDALQPSDLPPTHCQRCGHAKLEARPASGLEQAWAQLKRLLS
ncbi:MAG: hypothetical protein PHH47_11240 [Gallionella sp.]|nr:hypothetical protein [Gallionella sp.]MDD4947015.1 hypothetical protein [Gallionella sp.]